jgi:hypothetical protein
VIRSSSDPQLLFIKSISVVNKTTSQNSASHGLGELHPDDRPTFGAKSKSIPAVNCRRTSLQSTGSVDVGTDKLQDPPIAVLQFLAAASVEGDPGRVAALRRHRNLYITAEKFHFFAFEVGHCALAGSSRLINA